MEDLYSTVYSCLIENMPYILELVFSCYIFYSYTSYRIANNERLSGLYYFKLMHKYFFFTVIFNVLLCLEYCFHTDLASKTSSYLNLPGAEVGRGWSL